MTILLLGCTTGSQAQAVARPLPSWWVELQWPSTSGDQRLSRDVESVLRSETDNERARSHTATGLLVGGLIGVAATTVFLIGFCDDPDTQCGVDEVARAGLFIAVPAAAVGALIGYLIRTDE